MPQRTNQFQRLVFRIQHALYGTGALVTESAMVLNHESRKREEWDILVEFERGRVAYRTGIMCRDHRRRAGPGWIRDIAKQRDQCRLDKVIAAHGRGFTRAALDIARSERIVAVELAQIDEVDWRSELGPFDFVMSTGAFCRLSSIVAEFAEPMNNVETATEAELVTVGRVWPWKEIVKLLRKAIHEWVMAQLASDGSVQQLPESTSGVKRVRCVAQLQPDAQLVVAGRRCKIESLDAYGVCRYERRFGDIRRRFRYDESVGLEAALPMFEGNTSVVIVGSEHPKIDIAATENGTDLTFCAVGAEAIAPGHPFRQIECRWDTSPTLVACSWMRADGRPGCATRKRTPRETR